MALESAKSAHCTEQAVAYEHLVNLARKEKERKRNGGDGNRGERKGTDMGVVYQGLGS